MIGKHRQFREITLRDFRCFHERQTVPLAPLTLLVGENSTGKTSFLAAVQAVWDAAHGSGDPDFRKPPYDLGAFPEIVHGRGGHGSRTEHYLALRPDEESDTTRNRKGGRGNYANSFAIGFKELAPGDRLIDKKPMPGDRLIDFEVTFESRDAAPAPATTVWRHGKVSVEHRLAKGGNPRYVFESPNGSWCYPNSGEHHMSDGPRGTGFFSRLHLAAAKNDPLHLIDDWERSAGGPVGVPSSEDLAEFSFLSRLLTRSPAQEPPFASTPIHPSPRRTYDPVKLNSDPWGADVPSRFASLQFQDKAGWAALKEKLDAFGRESGLFDDFSVKQLTGVEGGPFQLQVRKFGKNGRKGPKRNLMDVGFGVSQVLPVLAALFRVDGPPMFLLQQPELHLHPSAQAALGSLFCRTAEEGRQLIIETHSDYLLDRIRLDVRDRRTKLKPEDVAILYFERGDLDVRIHPIRFDEDGNVRDTPTSYRRFFIDEVNRSIDY